MQVIEVEGERYLNTNEIAHLFFDRTVGSITIKTTKGKFFKVMTFTEYPDFHVWNSKGEEELYKENMEKEHIISYLMSRVVVFIVSSLEESNFVDRGELEEYAIDILNDFFLESRQRSLPSFPLNEKETPCK